MSLSIGERKYLIDGIVEAGVREDGRNLLDMRHLIIETNVLPLANGSCKLKQLLNQTDIICGIRIETINQQEISDDLISITVSLPNENNNNISKQLKSKLQTNLKDCLMNNKNKDDLLKGLVIVQNKFYWKVFIDITVFGHCGNLQDLISIATYAALKTSKRPSMKLINTAESKDFEIDPDERQAIQLYKYCDISINLTISIVQDNHFIIDCNKNEEACSDVKLILAMNKDGKICSINKDGKGTFDPLELPKIIDTAKQIMKQLYILLDQMLI